MAKSFESAVKRLHTIVHFGSDTVLPYMSALYNMKYRGNKEQMDTRLSDPCLRAVASNPSFAEAYHQLELEVDDMGHDKVMETYKSATDQILLYLHDDCCFQTDYPRFSLVQSMVNYVTGKGAVSLIDPNAGIGYFAIPKPEVKYYGYTPQHSHKLVAEILQDAYGCSDAHMELSPMGRLAEMIDAEALVTVLPVDFGPGGQDRTQVVEQYVSLFENYVFKRKELKAAAVVLNWHFLVDIEFKEMRKHLVRMGFVDKILHFPTWEFYKDSPDTCVLYLDFTHRHDNFQIYDFETMNDAHSLSFLRSKNSYDLLSKATDNSITTVSYNRIPDSSYCMHWGLFDYSKTKLESGQQLVSLEELVEFDRYNDCCPVDRYIYAEQLSSDLRNSMTPVVPFQKKRNWGVFKVRGARLAMTCSGGIRLAQIKDVGEYGVDELVYTMRVNEERISKEYLTYVLLEDRAFKNFFFQFTDKGTERVSTDILRKRCIPIWTDLSKQASIIEELVPISKINVVWADADLDTILTSQLQAQMRRKGIVLLDSAKDFSDLQRIVMDSISSHSDAKRIDAIVMDPLLKVEGYTSKERLPALQSMLSMRSYIQDGKWDCGLFLYTDLDDTCLDRFFQDPLFKRFYEKDHVFHKTGRRFIDLFDKIHKEHSRTIQPTVHDKDRYKPEYAAAQWVDELLGTRSVDLIAQSRNPDQYIDINTGYDPIRVVIHGLMERLQSMKIVPSSLQPGAVTQFLADGEYRDRKGMVYKIPEECRDRLIPKELAISLKYFTEIVNLAVHGHSTNLALRNVLVTIMAQAEIWFYELNRAEFAETSRFIESWKMNADYEFQPFEGTVQKTIINGVDYWYCKNVHLQFRSGLEEGENVKINSVGEEQRKVHIGDHDIVWYCRSRDYDSNISKG